MTIKRRRANKMTAASSRWPEGLKLHQEYIGPDLRHHLLDAVVRALREAPFFTPRMPRWGTPFSVRMTNFGPLGWVSDKSGYRYQKTHPETGRPWPPMPNALLKLWDEITGWPHPPEAALVNFYGLKARMGLHVDVDEAALDTPILSLSFGCEAMFRIGGWKRDDPTLSFRLRDGDVLLMGGEARHCYHGVDRILPGTGELPEVIGAGRINITLRRVTSAE